MITFNHKGNFPKINRHLERLKEVARLGILDKYGKEGVAALKSATPVDSGETADSWYYEIEHTRQASIIRFNNSNVNDSVPIAIILQYGHGTGTGGWVEGRDYINPAVRPVFDRIKSDVWREVTKV